MRKHRRFEKVDNSTVLTVQTPCMTPRLIMDLISSDVEPQVKARKGLYGQGSESSPIPRTMSIDRFSRMATPRPAPAQSPTLDPPPISTPPADPPQE